MITRCSEADIERIGEVINDAAQAYRGVIPDDCWHEPYMPLASLRDEIGGGVRFSGHLEGGELVGVMGSQPVRGVTLIRHAYVRPRFQGRGIGHGLLVHLLEEASPPVLVGTWSSAEWAIRFYRGHGFTLVSPAEARRLLRRYWSVPERQIRESSVLVAPG